MKFNVSLFFLLTWVSSCAVAQVGSLPAYENQIVDVQELYGATNYTLVLKCSARHPIITYAPESYQESTENFVYRYLMPNTTLLAGVGAGMEHVEQMGAAVQILLFGQILHQMTDDYTITFVVAK